MLLGRITLAAANSENRDIFRFTLMLDFCIRALSAFILTDPFSLFFLAAFKIALSYDLSGPSFLKKAFLVRLSLT